MSEDKHDVEGCIYDGSTSQFTGKCSITLQLCEIDKKHCKYRDLAMQLQAKEAECEELNCEIISICGDYSLEDEKLTPLTRIRYHLLSDSEVIEKLQSHNARMLEGLEKIKEANADCEKCGGNCTYCTAGNAKYDFNIAEQALEGVNVK